MLRSKIICNCKQEIQLHALNCRSSCNVQSTTQKLLSLLSIGVFLLELILSMNSLNGCEWLKFLTRHFYAYATHLELIGPIFPICCIYIYFIYYVYSQKQPTLFLLANKPWSIDCWSSRRFWNVKLIEKPVRQANCKLDDSTFCLFSNASIVLLFSSFLSTC